MRLGRCSSLAVVLITGPATIVGAAPPPASDTPAPTVSEEARALIDKGYAQFELENYEQAIELWEQAYELLPVSLRSQLQVPLATANKRAYEVNHDPHQLRKAQGLYTAYLETVDVDDERRAEIEAELAELEAELARLEALEQRERELAQQEQRQREQLAKLQPPAPPAPVDTPAKRMLPRWAEILGMSAGVGLLVGGAIMVAYAGGCVNGSDPTAPGVTPEDCPRVYQIGRNQIPGYVMVGVGGGLFVLSGVMLTVDEVRVGKARGRQAMLGYTFRF